MIDWQPQNPDGDFEWIYACKHAGRYWFADGVIVAITSAVDPWMPHMVIHDEAHRAILSTGQWLHPLLEDRTIDVAERMHAIMNSVTGDDEQPLTYTPWLRDSSGLPSHDPALLFRMLQAPDGELIAVQDPVLAVFDTERTPVESLAYSQIRGNRQSGVVLRCKGDIIGVVMPMAHDDATLRAGLIGLER